jgi:putative tryptophan/tyrosine transport system substrate-binding protein
MVGMLLIGGMPGHAQQAARLWRIGFLSPRARPASGEFYPYSAILQGMKDLGYVEGKDFVMDWRYADGNYGRLDGLASDLVQTKVDVIVASGPAVASAIKATKVIPIVMVGISDPIRYGFVASLAHPGGNVTGLSNLALDTGTKQLQLLHDTIPNLRRVAVLVNPQAQAGRIIFRQISSAATEGGVRILLFEAATPDEVDASFMSMAKEKSQALIATVDPFFHMQRHQIAELALRQRLPSVFANSEGAEAGGLMSYGHDLAEQCRAAAVYVSKILKGAKPGELPIEQSTKFELVVNMRTARTLGLKIPQSVLQRADRVIE